MKKVIFIVLFLILLSGCSKTPMKQEKVTTKIEQTKNMKVAMNYPFTNIPKLDSEIKKDINQDFEHFKHDYGKKSMDSEYNVSYTEQVLNNRYINIVMKHYGMSNTLANPVRGVTTYVFDKKQNRNLSLSDIIDKEELVKIIPVIKQAFMEKYKDCLLMDEFIPLMVPEFKNFPKWTIDDDYLTLYYNPYEITAGYCDIISVQIPLDKVGLKIDLERGVFEEKIYPKIEIPSTIIDPNKPVIALTFDDGPSIYTDEVLALLRKNNARATFFLIGNKIPKYEQTIRSIAQDGNELGNHSYSHKWLTRLKDDDLKEEIDITQAMIQKLTGHFPRVLRPTYGSINDHLRQYTKLDIVMWTVDTSDWKIKNAKKIASRAIPKIKDSSIILMHDTHQRTVDALKVMIPALKEKGYQFVTVSELEEVKLIRKKAKLIND